MLASGRSLGFGAGWPGALRGGPSVVYSSASDVKSFCVCFRYGIVYSRSAPPSWHGKYYMSGKYLCFHCSNSVTVPGGCRSQGCHGYPSRSARSG